jgi:hypothetical protein
MSESAEAQCGACQGTGLYVGMAERDGTAVVCHTCKGTGKTIIRWTAFTGRKRQEGVTHVLEANPGICVSTKLGGIGGMPFDAWQAGLTFPPGSEMRAYTCPRWWYQCADSSKLPEWDSCGFGRFTDCKHFDNKVACWARWDAENR